MFNNQEWQKMERKNSVFLIPRLVGIKMFELLNFNCRELKKQERDGYFYFLPTVGLFCSDKGLCTKKGPVCVKLKARINY